MEEKKMGTGKRYKGDTHYPIKSEEDVRAEQERSAQYHDKPGAMGLEAYCSLKGIRDPVTFAAMRAYTPAKGVKAATIEDWDQIFKDF